MALAGPGDRDARWVLRGESIVCMLIWMSADTCRRYRGQTSRPRAGSATGSWPLTRPGSLPASTSLRPAGGRHLPRACTLVAADRELRRGDRRAELPGDRTRRLSGQRPRDDRGDGDRNPKRRHRDRDPGAAGDLREGKWPRSATSRARTPPSKLPGCRR